MEIIYWTLFIFSIILFLVSIIALIYLLDEDEERNSIFFSPLLFLIVGIIFITANQIFSSISSIWIWRIGNLLSYIGIILLCWNYRTLIEKKCIPTIIIATGFSVIPFVLNLNIIETSNQISLLRDFELNFPSIILSFWLPLLVIVFIVIITYQSVIKNNHKEQNRFIRYLINIAQGRDPKEFDYNEKYRNEREIHRYREFEDKYLRNLIEEFQYRFDKYYRRNEELFYKQQELLKSNLNELSKAKRTEQIHNKFDDNNLSEIKDTIKELKVEIENIKPESNIRNSHYSNSTSQVFIRELYHFLITPLSQIETKAIIFEQNPLNITKNQTQFKKSISTIKTSIEICKSVLAAYRELAFVTSSSDWTPESLKQSIIAASHLYQETLEKQISLIIDLEDKFTAYSNNYLLAILLPLLENAIKAAPSNSEIFIENTVLNSIITFSIRNEAINTPTVQQLNTPGFSSKRDHKGTGLQIVRHLVKEQIRGELNFEIKNNTVITYIKLPNREKNE